MNKPTIVYYSILKYQDKNIEKLKKHFNFIELKTPKDDCDEILKQADVILAPLGFFFGKEKIDRAKKLKIIGSNTTGHPHIDIEYAYKNSIEVITLKNEQDFLAQITPTAELTWGLILSLTRNFIPAMESVKEGKWDRRPFGGNKMLSKMQLGVIGFGRLGKIVANYGISFGMKVSYYDPYVFEMLDEIEKVDAIDKIVRNCDVITIHVPHEKSTEKLISKELFDKFKRGSYFINTSRGELVDHEALLNSLKCGILAGAAIDVFENEFAENFENEIRKSPLWLYSEKNSNLLITPHIGGSTKDAWFLTEQKVIERILERLEFKKENAIENVDKNAIKKKIRKGSVWGLIPARGGSKSIPLKNMTEIDGRPLIEYSILSAKASKNISEIFCSTENDLIQQFCKDKNINVYHRPEHLSKDNVPTIDVIIDFILTMGKDDKMLPEYLVLLEPTSPFLLPEHIDNCIELLKNDKRADSSQTICEVEPNSHAYNQRIIDKNGSHFIFERKRSKCFNKQLKPHFYTHGNVRAMRITSLIENRNIFGKKSLTYEISKFFSLDVDGPDDAKIAECLRKCNLVELKHLDGQEG